VIQACCVHCCGCLSGNLSVKIPDLITSSCWITQSVWINAFDHDAGFPLFAAINSLCSPPRTPAVCHTVDCPSSNSISIYTHPTACCCSFLLLPVLLTIFKCTLLVICLVAALVALQWTNLYLHFCCVPKIDVIDVAPSTLQLYDPVSPGVGCCVWMTCWCGLGEDDDNVRKWEALSTL